MNTKWANSNIRVNALFNKVGFHDAIDELLEARDSLMEEMCFWKKELTIEEFSRMLEVKVEGYHNKTAAYSIYHIMRIEDIVVNSLIRNKQEILFTNDFVDRMKTNIITTGNELVSEQIAEFSKRLDLDVLYEYANAVKNSTDEWLSELTYEETKKIFTEEDKTRLKNLFVVCDREPYSKLIDDWCKLNVKDLIKANLLMHWIVHIEDVNIMIKKMI